MKDWYKSKTLWFAVITVGLGVLRALTDFGDWSPSPEQAQMIEAIVLVVVGVVTALLRLVTNEGIKR